MACLLELQRMKNLEPLVTMCGADRLLGIRTTITGELEGKPGTTLNWYPTIRG